jgi:hypothetical protein
MFRTILILALSIAAGCSATYETVGGSSVVQKLQAESVYVAVPANGKYNATVYVESGNQTAQAITEALRALVSQVSRGSVPESVDVALARAGEGGFQYLCFPTILHWGERATQWSGKPDRIQIRLDVLAVASGQLVDSFTFSGKSKWMTLGGDAAHELLSEPLRNYADARF